MLTLLSVNKAASAAKLFVSLYMGPFSRATNYM